MQHLSRREILGIAFVSTFSSPALARGGRGGGRRGGGTSRGTGSRSSRGNGGVGFLLLLIGGGGLWASVWLYRLFVTRDQRAMDEAYRLKSADEAADKRATKERGLRGLRLKQIARTKSGSPSVVREGEIPSFHVVSVHPFRQEDYEKLWRLFAERKLTELDAYWRSLPSISV